MSFFILYYISDYSNRPTIGSSQISEEKVHMYIESKTLCSFILKKPSQAQSQLVRVISKYVKKSPIQQTYYLSKQIITKKLQKLPLIYYNSRTLLWARDPLKSASRRRNGLVEYTEACRTKKGWQKNFSLEIIFKIMDC